MYTRAYTSSKDDLTAEPFGTPIFFTASTSTLARDGMSLRPDRWKLDNYHRSGGPVLWAHKHEMPSIGTGEGKVQSKLRVGVVFDQDDDFAKKIESKVRRKFIRGSSVGWDFVSSEGQVIPHHRAMASTLARDSWYDLSEMSIVNVPSDPFAVSERNWRALRSIAPGLGDLYEAQERWDSDVTEPELRRALIEYCDRLGLDLRYIRAPMTTEAINDLPDSVFAYIEPGGTKDDDGKTTPRSLRHFPVHDAAHVRNALARASQSPFGPKAMPKILAAAKKFNIDAAERSADEGWTRAPRPKDDEYDEADGEDLVGGYPGHESEDDEKRRDASEMDDEDVDKEEDDKEEDDEAKLVRRSDLPSLLRAHGLDPKAPQANRADTVDRRAAAAVLDAFVGHL